MPPPGSPVSPPGAPPGAGRAGSAALRRMQVESLGKSMIEGHEVEGKRYTLPPTAGPAKPPFRLHHCTRSKNTRRKDAGFKMPGMKMPGAACRKRRNRRGRRRRRRCPNLLPKPPSVTELWTSVKLKTPVLTKVSTAGGVQTTYCKPTETAEHPPSVFQVPPGYKLKPPTPPYRCPSRPPYLRYRRRESRQRGML